MPTAPLAILTQPQEKGKHFFPKFLPFSKFYQHLIPFRRN